MKILVNSKIKGLFCKMIVCIMTFILLAVLLSGFKIAPEMLIIFLCMGGMGVFIIIFCYNYFKEQNKIMETAVAQIEEYISGNHKIRIDCDEEGELYRLFHEVNSLAVILNAHIEEERRSKQFLKNTISDISHQLKTPLAALNIYNGLLQNEAADIPRIQEFTSLSETELDRIDALVQNLLKIAKLDAGSIVLDKKPENVGEMMKEVELHFAYRAEKEQKELSLSGEEDILLVCDRNWMLETVNNIVKNALDHTECGDTVEIKWKKSASVIQILVKDNGCGIHPEDIHHIFKRFYRSRFSKDKQGIGLGLSLAKMIIEAHNGMIEVKSELGKGSTFIISFLIPTKL